MTLSYAQRADAAVVVVLRRLLEAIEANVEGTIAGIEGEFLHDFRVSIRRSRAVQRELKGVFPRTELKGFRAEFRWLQQATGEARDLDVYVTEFGEYRAMVPPSMREDLEPLLDLLRMRRVHAREEMARALRSERCVSLLARWASFLDQLIGLPQEGRVDGARPIGELAGKQIRKVYRRILKLGRAIDPSSPAEAYHELRKKGKELRYLLELFGLALYPEEVVKPMIKTLKSVQDTLGRHQDREVQIAMLSSMREEIEVLAGGSAALEAMAFLTERLGEDAHAARDEFVARFAAFSSEQQQRLVKATFA